MAVLLIQEKHQEPISLSVFIRISGQPSESALGSRDRKTWLTQK